MMMTATEAGELLLESIKSKDALKSLAQVQQFKEGMRDATAGTDYVVWITEPVNLTRIHKALAEDLNIPPRALIIKRVAMSRTKKAVLFMQAMESAIRKVYKL